MQSAGNTSNPGPRYYGRYEVLKLLGEGAMGRVYLSEDPILKRRVAVKVISTDRNLAPAVLREYLERFALEAQACARLNHPSIVSIYDAGEQNGIPWIAFEYVSGEHLDRLIARQKQLPFDRIARIAGDIAAAMRHAHSMKIVHRDIKPANILIDDASQVAKLADFGVVKSPFTSITQEGIAVGSPGYMSPEQIDNLAVDARSDIFSFGIVLYEMITGAHPFLRETVQATFLATVGCNYKPISELRRDAPAGLVRIVEKALVADRNRRILSAEELCSMVAGCLDDTPSGPGPFKAGNSGRGIAARTGDARGRMARGALALWKRVLRFFGRAPGAIADFYKEKISPPVSRAADKIRAPFGKRLTKSQLAMALAGIISLAAAVVLVSLMAAANSKAGDRKGVVKAAQEAGYTVRSGKQLVDTCRAYVNMCDHWRAGEIADILITSKDKGHVLQGRLFKAMSALCADRFGDASDLFLAVSRLGGGEGAIRREHPFFIKYLEPWMERELPEALADLCAQRLYLSGNYQIKTWMKDRHYWVRWNAVNILLKGGERVDLVPVYILDLEYAASAKTKIRAAEKLGELGDRRAVPALIAARDGRGPAAPAARRALREKFDVFQ